MAKKGALQVCSCWNIFWCGELDFSAFSRCSIWRTFSSCHRRFCLFRCGIAVLTLIIGTLNPKGYIYEISTKIAPWFCDSLPLSSLLVNRSILLLSHVQLQRLTKLGISPLLSDANKGLGLIVFTILYFAAAYLISLNPIKKS